MTAARTSMLVLAATFTASTVAAQSAVMPLPAVTVVDGDGKTVGEVVDIFETSNVTHAVIVINVDGIPAFLHVRDYGLINFIASTSDGVASLYFSDPGCSGDAAIGQWGGIPDIVGARFGVAGPDPTLGTYKLYRSTATATVTFQFQSAWTGGVCMEGPGNVSLYPAEEVIPNPLEGFHGPTVAQPDRTWSLVGGTTIIPPAP